MTEYDLSGLTPEERTALSGALDNLREGEALKRKARGDVDEYYLCPNCARHVPENLSECPECGWRQSESGGVYRYADRYPFTTLAMIILLPAGVGGAVVGGYAALLMAWVLIPLVWGIERSAR